MLKTLLIYNPTAGRNRAGQCLDAALDVYQSAGRTLDIKRSNYAGEIADFFAAQDLKSYDSFVVIGGDGTINDVINGMIENKLDKPLGIVSCGTANDFARYLKLPLNPKKCFELFLRGNTKRVDLGCVNGRHFISVCAVGRFSHGYMKYDPKLKKAWGRAAYYIMGAADLGFKPANLRIAANDEVHRDKFQLVLVLNGTGTGGFPNISRDSTAEDGLLDVVAVKATPAAVMPALFVKMLNGELVRDKNVLYFQTTKMKIDLLEESEHFAACDVDGDCGPDLPLEIVCKSNALEVYCKGG